MAQFGYEIFGESHGPAVGVVMKNLPAGVELDMDAVMTDMRRRRAKSDGTTTTRVEADIPEILSGVFEGHLTGTPLCAMIRNENTRSGDYAELKVLPRPSHADYTGFVRYGGFADYRGGGHFSARTTAPLVFAGAVAKQILRQKGISVGAHILRIGSKTDTPFDLCAVNREQLNRLNQMDFPVLNEQKGELMRAEILSARADVTSVGGIIQCAVVGLEAGVGQNDCDSVESVICRNLFALPAVKGVEFGLGFGFGSAYGHEVNDQMYAENGVVKTITNYNGGILGGITNGMPIVFQAVFKPTPSISREQQTVNLSTMQNETLQIKGRHDPCVAARAAVIVEAAAALSILELLSLGPERKR